MNGVIAFGLDDLTGKHSCDEARLRSLMEGRGKMDCATARAQGIGYDDIIWAIAVSLHADEGMARRMIGFLNDCAKSVLPVFEGEYPHDDRIRRALIATDDWLQCHISDDAWQVAAYGAYLASREIERGRASRAAYAAWNPRHSWLHGRAPHTLRGSTRRLADAMWAGWSAWAAQPSADDRRAFQHWQFDRLEHWTSAEKPEGLAL